MCLDEANTASRRGPQSRGTTNKASKRLKLHLGENYRLVDSIDPVGRQSASAWMAISCGYSLLKQAVKALLHRRGDPRAERRGSAGHHIDKLYELLPTA